MVILRRGDHLHFLDNVEQEHETVRTMKWTGELAWIPRKCGPLRNSVRDNKLTYLCVGSHSAT
jgi:hypothetical protein